MMSKWPGLIWILFLTLAVILGGISLLNELRGPPQTAQALYLASEVDEALKNEAQTLKSASWPAPTAGPGESPRREEPKDEPRAGTLPPAVLSEVDKAVSDLSPGLMVFNPLEKMRAGITERIEVRITRDAMAGLTNNLVGHGKPSISKISVGVFMQARLTSADEGRFEIRALNSEEQLVARLGATQWNWDVTPLRAGVGRLQLVVTVRVVVPGYSEGVLNWPVVERQVQVGVNPSYSLWKLWKNNWQSILGWLGGGISAAGLMEWFRRWWRKRPLPKPHKPHKPHKKR